MNYSSKIAEALNLSPRQVEKTIELLEGGATVPFIARYRKEATGSLNEVQIAAIRDMLIKCKELDKRRDSIIQSIEEQGKLTPELKKQLLSAETMTELEDLYLPYKPKRKTRASIAIEKGLEPLANSIMLQQNINLDSLANKYVNEEKGVANPDEALAGARDIIAERINEDATARNRMRALYKRTALLTAKVAKGKEEEGEKYSSWFDWEEDMMKAPSHRILAMFRGETKVSLKLRYNPKTIIKPSHNLSVNLYGATTTARNK